MRKIRALFLAVAALGFVAGLSAGENDITVFRPGVNPRNKKDPMVMAKVEYEKQTGGKVTFLMGDWGTTTTKVISNLAAGTPIDVVWASAEMFPRYYTKGYVQPLDGWVNLKAPNLNIPVMDKFFKYGGKYYLASNKGSNHSRIVMFNKTLMEEEGLSSKEMPDALYKAGKWNFDAMRTIALKMTKDTDGDGKIDRWGFGGYDYAMFVFMNGASFTTIDSKGVYKLNFDDPRLLEGLNYLYQAYNEGWFMPDNAIASQGLQRRTLSMYTEGSWFTESIQKETKDEIVAVPWPVGPGNKDKAYSFGADGYAIGAGSKKQKAAGKYIDICTKIWDDFDQVGIKARPKYILKFLEETGKNQEITGMTTGVLESCLNDILGTIAWGGADPKQRLEAIRPVAQAAVDDANEPPEVPTQLPFKDVVVDFTNGDFSAFSLENKKQSVKFSIVSGAEAIDGKSLKISMDGSKDGKEITILTDPEKLGLVGYRDYLFSYSIKIIKDPASPETAVRVNVYQGKYKFGSSEKGLVTKDEVVNVTDAFRNIYKNGKFGLRFTFHDAVDVVIDDIKIKLLK